MEKKLNSKVLVQPREESHLNRIAITKPKETLAMVESFQYIQVYKIQRHSHTMFISHIIKEY